MNTTIEFYPTCGYVVEIETNDGTYQLCPERDYDRAELNKRTIDEIIKLLENK